jgi:hypothetical protein
MVNLRYLAKKIECLAGEWTHFITDSKRLQVKQVDQGNGM